MAQLEGTIASRGYAYGQAFLLREKAFHLHADPLPPGDRAAETRRLQTSLHAVRQEIRALQDKAETILDAQSLAIFSSYLVLLDDADMIQAIEDSMEETGSSAAWAVHTVLGQHAEAMAALDNPYMRERATDIRDLERRLIENLLGLAVENVPALSGRILVADDLSPAQSVQLNLHQLEGLLTDRGGLTSHTSILARALNIPAIVGTRRATALIQDADWILLDAIHNKIWINPDADVLQSYEGARRMHHEEQTRLAALIDRPGQLQDGTRITLAANIGLPTEIPAALAQGAEGIGLFRTEFLFMNRRDLPDEEEQYAVYRAAAEAMQPHPVIIRTLDIGGDKDLPHLGLQKEENPFLGRRGVRVSLWRPDLLRTQLRALIRAAAHGSVKIMFPMVAAVEEVIELRRILAEERAHLPAVSLEIGIMIETPASVMLAEHLIRYLDFFSIGTNDLTQYTLAVDRGNVDVRDLYQPLAPAVLLMLEKAMEAATKAGKWVGVCGELAGDPMAALLLVGLGATELSMSAGSLSRVKQILLQTHRREIHDWTDEALRCATVAEVKTLLDTWRADLNSQ